MRGKLRQHTYTTDTGSRSTFELDIDDIGPSLRHRTAHTGPPTRRRHHTVPAGTQLVIHSRGGLSTAVRARGPPAGPNAK